MIKDDKVFLDLAGRKCNLRQLTLADTPVLFYCQVDYDNDVLWVKFDGVHYFGYFRYTGLSAITDGLAERLRSWEITKEEWDLQAEKLGLGL